MAKKSKLQNLNQIDAKEELGRPTTLDQIWGDTGLQKYGTNNFDEYKAHLRSLNRSDIQANSKDTSLLIKPLQIISKSKKKSLKMYRRSYQKVDNLV